MIIVKCTKEDCKGHMVAWNIAGVPVLVPNADHVATGTVKITPEIREQLNAERNAEPFRSFMDVVEEEQKKNGR